MHKLFSMYLFLFITLYMFREHRAHHQERQIVSIQPLITVYVGGRDVCRLEEESSSKNRNKYTENNLCITLVIYQEL